MRKSPETEYCLRDADECPPDPLSVGRLNEDLPLPFGHILTYIKGFWCLMEPPHTSVSTLTNAPAVGPNRPAAHALDGTSSGALHTCSRARQVSQRGFQSKPPPPKSPPKSPKPMPMPNPNPNPRPAPRTAPPPTSTPSVGTKRTARRHRT